MGKEGGGRGGGRGQGRREGAGKEGGGREEGGAREGGRGQGREGGAREGRREGGGCFSPGVCLLPRLTRRVLGAVQGPQPLDMPVMDLPGLRGEGQEAVQCAQDCLHGARGRAVDAADTTLAPLQKQRRREGRRKNR